MKDNKIWKVDSQHLDADPGKRDKINVMCQTEVQKCYECEMNRKSWSAADFWHLRDFETILKMHPKT